MRGLYFNCKHYYTGTRIFIFKPKRASVPSGFPGGMTANDFPSDKRPALAGTSDKAHDPLQDPQGQARRVRRRGAWIFPPREKQTARAATVNRPTVSRPIVWTLQKRRRDKRPLERDSHSLQLPLQNPDRLRRRKWS